ncbi:MAG: GntR family transcriptional regulator [Deinococcales bacterium]
MARRTKGPDLDLKMESLSELRRKSMADVICDSLREAILSQQLQGGTPLIEKQLAEQFGVSKTPVREALLRLAQTGLVDFIPVKGATVHQLDFKEIEDILEMRLSLEPMAFKQSAPKLTANDIKALKELLEQAKIAQKAQHFAELSRLNNDFHNLLYSRAENKLLLNYLAELNDRRKLISVAGWRQENRSAEELKEHWAIVEALEVGDVGGAVGGLEHHIQTFSNLILRHHPLAKERETC